jgi:membrane protease YdiL (CAAX protease family)
MDEPHRPRAAIASLWNRLVLEPLRWIETHREVPPGRVSANARIALIFLSGALCLIMLRYGGIRRQAQGGTGQVLGYVFGTDGGAALPPLAVHSAWALACVMCYFVIPALIIRTILGHRLRDYGLRTDGFFRHLKIYVLLFIPVGVLVWFAAQRPEFQQTYPFYRHPQGWQDLLMWECLYAAQFFSLEFFFRGFMLHGLKDRFGAAAIGVMVIPYTMIHFAKPLPETLGAVIAGTVLGILSLRTGTIWGGVLIHVAVAISMDLAALAMRS